MTDQKEQHETGTTITQSLVEVWYSLEQYIGL